MLVAGDDCVESVGVSEHFGFTLQVDFGVDVGGVDRDVAEPRADGVDVDAGAQQMRGGCVPDGVRAEGSTKQRSCSRWSRKLWSTP